MVSPVTPRPVTWMGSSRVDLKRFPPSVRRDLGRHDTNAYRAVYTAQFEEAVYVLHAFPEEVEERHRNAEV